VLMRNTRLTALRKLSLRFTQRTERCPKRAGRRDGLYQLRIRFSCSHLPFDTVVTSDRNQVQRQ
jgi:hypothetical protein